jgi:predicted ATPase
MYLSRFQVQNYKCLANVDIPLTPFHVIIGENDSGKTSLLEAMARLYGCVKPFSSDFLSPLDQLLFHRSDRCTLAGSWSNPGDDTPAITLTIEQARTGTAKGVIGIPGESSTYHSEEMTQFDRYMFKVRQMAEKFPPALQSLSHVLEKVVPYAFNPQRMRTSSALDPEQKFSMSPDGSGLSALLGDILEHDAEQFSEIGRRFRESFPQFTSVSLESSKPFRALVLTRRSHSPRKTIIFETSRGLRLPASEVSDGAIFFLGLLALAHVPNPPKLLLIEEPENNVSPKRLADMIQLMRDLVGREDEPAFPQIILTTRSPYVLNSFAPEEVTCMSRYPDDPGQGVRARPLSTAKNLESYGKEFYLGELWYNLDEEELFGEP